MTTYKELEQKKAHMDKKYSVWVGGVEVNDYYLNLEQAENLADEYIVDDHGDVVIERVKQ